MARQIANSTTILNFLKINDFLKLIDLNKIKCEICDSSLTIIVEKGVTPLNEHLKTEKHLYGLKIIENMKNENHESIQFHKNFLMWMLNNNIPLSKLDNCDFKNYLENLSGKQLFTRQHYMNHFLPDLYNQEIKDIFNHFNYSPYYLMLDEFSDKLSRKVVNILIGELNEFELKQPYLINTLEFETVNSDTLFNFLSWQVNKIHSSHLLTSNFKLLLSDKASYMLSLGSKLKLQFQQIKHVTCLCHALHNLCETIRKDHKNVKKCMKQLIFVIKKKQKNKLLFEETVQSKFPKTYICTRWGSYISFACFFYENYQLVCELISKLKEKDQKKLQIFLSEQFKVEIESIYKYKFLVKAISSLESSTLSVKNQINIIQDVVSKVENSRYEERINDILSNNPDLDYFMNYNILNVSFEERMFSNAPLTTCHVERSFSKFGIICSNDRTNLIFENIKRLLFFYFK